MERPRKCRRVKPRISTSAYTLAEMIGTTRSRVSFFMNRFKKMGLIHYESGLRIHSSLLNVVLHDQPLVSLLTLLGANGQSSASSIPAI
jgi:hypothetical protein